MLVIPKKNENINFLLILYIFYQLLYIYKQVSRVLFINFCCLKIIEEGSIEIKNFRILKFLA